MNDLILSETTLILMPCSGAKAKGNAPIHHCSVMDHLDAPLSERLAQSREGLREAAQVDGSAMAACKRYTGELYACAAESVQRGAEAGQPILIVSGGYGLLEPDEPIAWYNRALHLADWPIGLLEDCIANYARHKGATSVLAVMARTSSYAKLVRRLRRRHPQLPVKLVSPVSGPNAGAQGKVPRAQGQVLRDLLRGDRVPDEWTSSEGLPLDIQRI